MKMSYSRFLVFSHAGGGTKLHKDAWGSGFWNTCVHGQKRWLFIRHFTGRAREVAVDEKWFEVRLLLKKKKMNEENGVYTERLTGDVCE